VTADIGVRDHASVARARGLGIDVIVVDHHLPAGESVPPDALAVLCPPQEGCAYPNKALAACGVSYKLASALLEGDPQRERILASLRKLVAIGTVADVVDLGTPENRSLLRRGLATLNEGGHAPGLTALLEVARSEDGPITAATLGWRIGPRINAAGRLEDANAVVRLLRERDPARAQAQARELDRLNAERQEIQLGLYEQALAAVPDPLPGFVVVAGPEAEGWHRGVVGIVASKVRERVNRPVAVVSLLGGGAAGTATGSVRSVPGVHAVRALDACADLLHRYGGHAAAAGFSLDAARVPTLARRLAAWVDAHHDADDLAGDEPVDLLLEGRALTLPLVQAFGALEPTGKGMEPPRIAIRGPFTDLRVTGGKHLFFQAAGAPCVWWNGAALADTLAASDVVIGAAEVNAWRGQVSARLRVEAVGR
jgi:single-stranded-DNA-specific exonuclease